MFIFLLSQLTPSSSLMRADHTDGSVPFHDGEHPICGVIADDIESACAKLGGRLWDRGDTHAYFKPGPETQKKLVALGARKITHQEKEIYPQPGYVLLLRKLAATFD